MEKNVGKFELSIASTKCYNGNLYRVRCESAKKLPHMAAGQFAHIKVPNKDLRRPICIYDNDEHSVTFIIASVGAGTAAFTAQKVGATFDALLPL